MRYSVFWKGVLAAAAIALSVESSDMPPGQGLDIAGLPINNTDVSRHGPGGCHPKPKCTHAGGYCVTRRKDCDGLVLHHGCKGRIGGEKCMCCVSDPCKSRGGVSVASKCLYFSSDHDEKSWEDAKVACDSKGQLAILAEPKEPALLLAYVLNNYAGEKFWLGGCDIPTEGDWVWINNGPFSTSFPWGPGQPDNYGGNEHCLMVPYDSNYNDDPCEWTYRYICELQLGGSSQTKNMKPRNKNKTNETQN